MKTFIWGVVLTIFMFAVIVPMYDSDWQWLAFLIGIPLGFLAAGLIATGIEEIKLENKNERLAKQLKEEAERLADEQVHFYKKDK